MNSNDLTTTGLFNPTLRMSSVEIASLMEKEHKNVLRDIRELIDQEAIDRLRFEPISYLDSMNREQLMYQLDFESTMVLVTGYDPKRRALVINRWAQLERGEVAPAVQSFVQDERITAQDELIRLYRKCEALLDEKIATLTAVKQKRQHRPMTEEEREQIIAMVASGLSQKAVAREMRRSSATVSYLVSERLRAAGANGGQMELFPAGVLEGGEA